MIATTVTTSTPDWLAALIVLAAPAAALIATFVAQRMEARRQRVTQDRDRDLRTEERQLRAADHERQTLHDLQEALVELLESTFDLAWQDEGEATEDHRTRQFQASARVTMLTQRVADDHVREAVNAAAVAFEEIRRTDFPSAELTNRGRELQDVAQGAIGQALRGLP